MTGKKIIVTGGAGFIGTNVTELLLQEGYAVTVVDNFVASPRERVPPGVEVVEIDVRETAALARVFVGALAIIHLAALPRVQFSIDEPEAAHAVNVDGTVAVLEAARRARVARVVFASSSAVYGDQEQLPLSEDLPPAPKSPYALHKLVGEQYLHLWSTLYDIETVSLRFFNVYGPHLDPDGSYALVIGRFLKQVALGEPLTITGTGSQTRDFVHVQDVARAVLAAVVSPNVGRGEVINIGSGTETSINDLATLLSDNHQYIAPRIEPQRTRADIKLATTLLGWQPRITLAEGVASLRKIFGLPG